MLTLLRLGLFLFFKFSLLKHLFQGLSSSDNLYIAAQAPLENTLGDWWRMVWEQQIKVVLMLTALQENGVVSF